jgi:hypothetical protein
MKYYWTMRNGQQIDVDLMTESHLRNTLKMLIRNSKKKSVVSESRIGNIEANFLEELYKEYEDESIYEY